MNNTRRKKVGGIEMLLDIQTDLEVLKEEEDASSSLDDLLSYLNDAIE